MAEQRGHAESEPLGPIERVKMPNRYDGKRVGDKFACGYGHLHPSHAHAAKCRKRHRTDERSRIQRR